MNKTKKFFYNSLSVVILQIVKMAVGFILPRIMLKYYGSEINGLVTSIVQFISYFNLVEAGLGSAAVYALYKPLSTKNKEKISEVVSTAKSFYYKSGILFTILVTILALLYPVFIQDLCLSKIETIFLILILGGNGILQFFTMAKYRTLLTADQKIYITSIAEILYYIINTTIIVILAKFNINIVIIKLIALSAIITRSAFLTIYVRKKYSYINYKCKPNNKLVDKRWDALFLQILGTVQQGFPVVILTLMSNLLTVSVFSIYNMVFAGINNLLSIFTSGLSSSFGIIIAEGDKKNIQKTTAEFEYFYYNIITIIYSVTIAMIMPFISLYTKSITDVNYYIPIIGILFTINGIMYNLKTPQGMLVISAGLYKETRKQTSIQTAILLILGVALTYRFNIIGIMIASIFSNLYRVIDLTIFASKNITENPIKKTIYKQIKTILIIALTYIVSTFAKLQISNYFEWIMYAGIIFIIVSIFLLMIDLVFERKNLKSIIERIKMIARR